MWMNSTPRGRLVSRLVSLLLGRLVALRSIHPHPLGAGMQACTVSSCMPCCLNNGYKPVRRLVHLHGKIAAVYPALNVRWQSMWPVLHDPIRLLMPCTGSSGELSALEVAAPQRSAFSGPLQRSAVHCSAAFSGPLQVVGKWWGCHLADAVVITGGEVNVAVAAVAAAAAAATASASARSSSLSHHTCRCSVANACGRQRGGGASC
jgi:hypothetical protein